MPFNLLKTTSQSSHIFSKLNDSLPPSSKVSGRFASSAKVSKILDPSFREPISPVLRPIPTDIARFYLPYILVLEIRVPGITEEAMFFLPLLELEPVAKGRESSSSSKLLFLILGL